MFNHDIRKFISEINTEPTDTFRATLQAKIRARAPQPIRAPRPWMTRSFVLAGAMIAIVIVAYWPHAQTPARSVLAKAIDNTFGFLSEHGYHHQKMSFSIAGGGEMERFDQTSEYWQDDSHAIMDFTNNIPGGDKIPGAGDGSTYVSSADKVMCGYGAGTGSASCWDPMETMTGSMGEFHAANTLVPYDIHVEAAPPDEHYGSSYLTWTTDAPLPDSYLRLSSLGAFGIVDSEFRGTYGWWDGGRYVNRVTLPGANPVPIAPDSTEYLIQIVETEPITDTFDGAKVLGESPVYKINTATNTIEVVDEAWLQASRKALQEKTLAYETSVQRLRDNYTQLFDEVFWLEKSAQDARVSEQQIFVNGRSADLLTYDLRALDGGMAHLSGDLTDTSVAPAAGTIQINNDFATRAEVVIDHESQMILWYTFFNADDIVLEHAEILLTEERPESPPGIFDLEAWKQRVQDQFK